MKKIKPGDIEPIKMEEEAFGKEFLAELREIASDAIDYSIFKPRKHSEKRFLDILHYLNGNSTTMIYDNPTGRNAYLIFVEGYGTLIVEKYKNVVTTKPVNIKEFEAYDVPKTTFLKKLGFGEEDVKKYETEEKNKQYARREIKTPDITEKIEKEEPKSELEAILDGSIKKPIVGLDIHQLYMIIADSAYNTGLFENPYGWQTSPDLAGFISNLYGIALVGHETPMPESTDMDNIRFSFDIIKRDKDNNFPDVMKKFKEIKSPDEFMKALKNLTRSDDLHYQPTGNLMPQDEKIKETGIIDEKEYARNYEGD